MKCPFCYRALKGKSIPEFGLVNYLCEHCNSRKENRCLFKCYVNADTQEILEMDIYIPLKSNPEWNLTYRFHSGSKPHIAMCKFNDVKFKPLNISLSDKCYSPVNAVAFLRKCLKLLAFS